MRVLVRKEIDITEKPNLMDLKPKDRIKVSLAYAYSNLRFVKKKVDKELNKEAIARRKMMEDLKLVILYHISKRFKKDDNSVIMTELDIARKFDPVIKDTVGSADFLQYDITRVKENPDFLIAFPELPILLEIRRKGYRKDEAKNNNSNSLITSSY